MARFRVFSSVNETVCCRSVKGRLWMFFCKQKILLKKDLQKKTDQQKQRNGRFQRKRALQEKFELIPELSKRLKLRPDKGRPPIETVQSELPKTLIDFAQHGASADEGRRYIDMHKDMH